MLTSIVCIFKHFFLCITKINICILFVSFNCFFFQIRRVTLCFWAPGKFCYSTLYAICAHIYGCIYIESLINWLKPWLCFLFSSAVQEVWLSLLSENWFWCTWLAYIKGRRKMLLWTHILLLYIISRSW